MEKLFIQILNMSISAGYFILAVILLRILLKKVPKNIICVLWLLVGIRLLLPFSMETVIGLIPESQVVDENIMYEEQPVINSGMATVDRNVNRYLQKFGADETRSVNPMQIVIMIFTRIWVVGMLLMTGYFLVSWWQVKKRVRGAVPLVTEEGKLYESEAVISPFLLGVVHPGIYLPTGLQVEEQSFVIAHEKAHIARRDHLIKPLAFLILSVYWFHPLVWAAYILLCRDIELACDERVIRSLGMECKKEYSQALLNCSVNRKMIMACPVAFGEVGVKERIKNILHYKKPGFGVLLVAIVICVVTSVCFLTQRKPKEEAAATKATEESESTDTTMQSEAEETTIFHVTIPESIRDTVTYRIEDYKTLVWYDQSQENELGTMTALSLEDALNLTQDAYALIGNYGNNAFLSGKRTTHSYSNSETGETTYQYMEEDANGEQDVPLEEPGYSKLPNAQGTYDMIELGEQNTEALPNETIANEQIPTGYCYLFVYPDESRWSTEQQAGLKKLQGELVAQLDQVQIDEIYPTAALPAEQYINVYAQAYCDRNGKTLIPMLSEETAAQMEKDSLMTVGEEYFGWSSPWPMWSDPGYQILYMEKDVSNGEKQAEILYYADTSDPHVWVWRETITYTMENHFFMITDEKMEYLDAIATAEEFYLAYPEGRINDTPMDYKTNTSGEYLNQNAKGNPDSKWYQPLFSPDTAAVYLLNLVDSKVSVDSAAEGVTQLSILFTEDNSSVGITMIQPYGMDGIWIPQDNEAKME